MNQVQITIAGIPSATKWTLRPYNPPQGVEGAPDYLVSTFAMRVSGIAASFNVLRFGIKRTPVFDAPAPPQSTRCDVGIVHQHVYHPPWIMYIVHSGPGSIPGAWQLQGKFLLHEGSPDPDVGWGTYGCMEVVGRGEWARLLEGIKQIAGTRNLTAIGKAKALTVHVEAAHLPVATLKPSFSSRASGY